MLCDYTSANNLSLPFYEKALKDLLLLLLYADNVNFTFEGGDFRQIDGVVMGSSLGSLLVYVENLAEDSIRKVCLYKRYVNGIIIISDKSEDVNSFLNEPNTSQKHISFRCEEERNNQLTFLDILISRRDYGLITLSVYIKMTQTG